MAGIVLSRRTLSQAGALYARVPPKVINGIGRVLNRRTLSITTGDVAYAPPVIIEGSGIVLSRRTLSQVGALYARVPPKVINGIGIPTIRSVLPLLSDIDTAQIIVRGGLFEIDFDAEPKRGLPPHGVDFYNLSRSPIRNWTWYFGDGNSSHDENPEHIYLDEGEYDVTLVAGSPIYGYSQLTKYRFIIVGIVLTIVPTSGPAPLTVRYGFDERQI